MKIRMRTALLLCLLVGTLLIASGCAGAKTPYQINDEEGFNVSVKYDANGGTFTTNVTVMVDSFNVSNMDHVDGQAQIALLSPDDAQRGKGNSFMPVNNGHFLLGWYSQRELGEDGEYVYSGKWDFQKDKLSVPVDAEHSASEPVMTLYAVWAPLLQIEIYDMEDPTQPMDTISYDPNLTEVSVPYWDTDKGTVDMEDFPEKKDFTFDAVYYDEAGTIPVTTPTVVHSAKIDETNGTVNDATMKLYVDWLEGEWYHIYSAEQFVDNASLKGNYVIFEDLDFSDENWPSSFIYGNFKGSIQGNGHTFRNLEITQTNNSKNYAGIFGNVTEQAEITDLTLENVTFTIKKGTRVVGTNFGLFAGHISEDAKVEGVKILDSVLQVDSGIYYTEDSEYIIGLVCAMGDPSGIDHSGISCVAVGDEPEKVQISVSEDGMVDIHIDLMN